MKRPFGLTAAIFGLFTALGVSSTLFGLIISEATTALGISLVAAGLVTTLFAVGRIVGSFVGGPLTDRAGGAWVTAAGTATMLLGLAGLGAAPWASVFFLGSFVMGAGFGALDVALNTDISALHPQRRGSMLSLLHGFYGVGSFVGPLLIGLVIAWTGSWRAAPGLVALLFVGAGLWYRAFTDRAERAGSAAGEGKPAPLRVGLLTLLQQPAFLLIVPVGFIYQGVSWSLSLWLPTFMAQVHGAAPLQAASAVSILWGGLTVGRFVNSAVIRVLGDGNALLLGAGGSFFALTLGLVAPRPSLLLVALFVTGLALSTLIPTSISVLTRLWPETAGTVSGVFMTISAAGVLFFPWFQGVLAELWGMRAGLGTGILALLLLVVIVAALRRLLRTEARAVA
jgi:fucose permease